MMKTTFVIFLLIFCNPDMSGQQTLVENGRIVYERKINLFAILPDILVGSGKLTKTELPVYMQNYKTYYSQFLIDSFQLFFNREKAYYEPINVRLSNIEALRILSANQNKVYTNFLKSIVDAEKLALNESIWVRDSVKKIRWKFTDETREIAGFECRRANGLLDDSIYVVAFYADAITTTGGPELFNGLPGMIMGVALPHYHVSYFASRVQENIGFPDDAKKLSAAVRSSSINQKDFETKVMMALKADGINCGWLNVFIGL